MNAACLRVAALFVEKDGAYFGLPNVDPWDETRDARLYEGPWPVVAHPPCARWSRLARFCEVRHGLKVGEDGGCFEAALHAVRKWGGVIEHPAFSKAWAHFDLPRPDTKYAGWMLGTDGGASCYVEQGRYGHVVKKATWLYAYGVHLPELRWGYTPDSRGTISTNQDWRGGMDKWRDATGYAAANATPPDFRAALLGMARSAARPGGCSVKPVRGPLLDPLAMPPEELARLKAEGYGGLIAPPEEDLSSDQGEDSDR